MPCELDEDAEKPNYDATECCVGSIIEAKECCGHLQWAPAVGICRPSVGHLQAHLFPSVATVWRSTTDIKGALATDESTPLRVLRARGEGAAPVAIRQNPTCSRVLALGVKTHDSDESTP